MTGPGSMIRRDQAANKARRQPSNVEPIQFRIEGSDILFLDGKYVNQFVSQVFFSGPEGRDYVTKHIWFSNDESAMMIIRSFLCK